MDGWMGTGVTEVGKLFFFLCDTAMVDTYPLVKILEQCIMWNLVTSVSIAGQG